jgi:hypothetical protein
MAKPRGNKKGGIMNHRWRTVVLSCLVVFALLSAVSLSCGKTGPKVKYIVIGNVTDLTGAASTALVPLNMGLADMVKEFNAGLNPGPKLPAGVQLKVQSYDTALDPSRFLPGYDWVRSKGAQVIFSILSDCSDVLKDPAARDKVPVCGFASDFYQISPPGWVFDFDSPAQWSTNLIVQWVSDHWDYTAEGRAPTIAIVGWSDAWGAACADGVKAYVQAYPDSFTLTGTYLEPVMTTSWSGVVSKTLDVDYVMLAADGGIAPSTFWKQYKDNGGTGINIDSESQSAYAGYITDYCGWADLDGKLNTQGWGLWTLAGTGTVGNGTYPVVQSDVKYTLDVLTKYHPNDVANQIKAGMGYMGGASMQLEALKIVVAAINAVGADNFSGQAFYDTATNYSTTWAGNPMSFSANNRVFVTYQLVDKWDAATKSLIMVSPGWLLVPQIPPA